MQRVDRRQHLLHTVRFCARTQLSTHPKRELGFRDPHVIGPKRQLPAAIDHRLAQQSARQRSVDGDVPLSRQACRRDLPSEQRRRASLFQMSLHAISFRAGLRDESPLASS